MADVHNPQTRSYNMSRIRSKDTKPELLVRKYLHAQGFRFRLHGQRPSGMSNTPSRRGEGGGVKKLPGKPDIILPKYKTVVFVHGCFWHGHKFCKYFKLPGTNTLWWLDKINRNRENDKKAIKSFKKEGFQVIIIWECDLKKDKAGKTLAKLVLKLKPE